MSSYDPQSWQVPIREATWEQGPPSARLSPGSTIQHEQHSLSSQLREQSEAFSTQFEEVDRAFENLAKSGKLYAGPPRRDSLPMMGGPPPFTDFGHRIPHRHSVDYDQIRSQANSNLQNYYAHQRQQPRQNEVDQMMQTKRRMAAQRERELRNYHQEQQYNRNINAQGRTDRAISPNTMNEEDRRDLIARQHRALYGSEAPFYEDESNTPRPPQPTAGHVGPSSARGPSPQTYDSFNVGQGQSSVNPDEVGQLNPSEQIQTGGKGPSPNPQQGASHENSTASPASNPPSQTFSMFESAAQQSSRTSTSSPGASPPRQGKPSSSGVAPIGTRPAQASNPALSNRRSGTPSQSPLSHGFSMNNDNLGVRGSGNERSTSSASNPSSGAAKDSSSSAWGAGSGVWGNTGNNKSVGAVWG